MIKRRSLSLAAAAALALILGCKVAPPSAPLVQTVAVLPFDSESNDINAPDILQRLVYLALKPSAYQVADPTMVDAHLKSVNIVDGGQLAAVDPTKLGKDLGVQALLFGNVESFGYTNIGFYEQRKVAVELKLVDVASGQILWQNTGSVANRQVHLDAQGAKQALARGLVEQAAEKIMKSPLQDEAEQATKAGLRTLPGFRFAGFAVDEKTQNGVQVGLRHGVRNAIRR